MPNISTCPMHRPQQVTASSQTRHTPSPPYHQCSTEQERSRAPGNHHPKMPGVRGPGDADTSPLRLATVASQSPLTNALCAAQPQIRGVCPSTSHGANDARQRKVCHTSRSPKRVCRCGVTKKSAIPCTAKPPNSLSPSAIAYLMSIAHGSSRACSPASRPSAYCRGQRNTPTTSHVHR